MTSTKQFIVAKAGFFNTFIGLLYRLFGYDLWCLEQGWWSAKVSQFQEISFGEFSQVDLAAWFSLVRNDLAEKIMAKLNLQPLSNDISSQFFNGLRDEYVTAFLMSSISAMDSDLQTILYMSSLSNESVKKIKVLNVKYSLLHSTLGNDFMPGLKVSPVLLLNKNLAFCYLIASKISKLIFQRMVNFLHKLVCKKVKQHEVEQAEEQKPCGQNERYSKTVAYFPHKGVSCGPLYEKNSIYQDENGAGVSPDSIIHFEYNAEQNRAEIESDYLRRGFEYDFFSLISAKQVMLFMLKQLRSGLFYRCLFRSGILVTAQIYYRLLQVDSYYKHLLKYPNLKLAIVGYDLLFPTSCSLALKMHKVPTVAFQERLDIVLEGCGDYKFYDQYFVWGQAIADYFQNTLCGQLSSIKPLGLPRCYMLEQHLPDRELNRAEFMSANGSSFEKLIICFDYHSGRVNSKDNPEVNWEVNRHYYRDIANLSASFPTFLFVLRGKDAFWLSLPYFDEIKKLIAKQANILVDQNYTQTQRSYYLSSLADLVIAKHTSIADDCLAYDIPVLFHDYSHNYSKHFSSVYDYEGADVFVNSYSKLESRVKDVLLLGKYETAKKLSYLKKRLFNESGQFDVLSEYKSQLTKLVEKGVTSRD